MAGWVLNRVSSTSPLIMSRSATASVPWQEKAIDIKPICAAGVEVNCKNKRQTGTFNSCKSKRFRVYPWKLSTANNLFVFYFVAVKAKKQWLTIKFMQRYSRTAFASLVRMRVMGWKVTDMQNTTCRLRYMKPLKSTLHNGCFFCWTYEAFQLVNTSRGPYWYTHIRAINITCPHLSLLLVRWHSQSKRWLLGKSPGNQQTLILHLL